MSPLKKQAQSRSEGRQINLLDLKPVHNRKWIEIGDDRIAVLQPRFSNEVVKKIIDPLLRDPDIRIRLDEFGSFVWRQCDGQHTVSEIRSLLIEKFGDSVAPALERLELFLKYLERYQFIRYFSG